MSPARLLLSRNRSERTAITASAMGTSVVVKTAEPPWPISRQMSAWKLSRKSR